MAGEPLIACAGYLIGWLVLRPFIRQFGAMFLVSSAFATGAAAWVFLSAWILALQIPFSPGHATLGACAIAGGLNCRFAARLTWRETRYCFGGLVVVAVLAAAFTRVDLTLIGADGFWVIYVAHEIALDGTLSADTRFLLLNKNPVFQILIHALAPAVGKTNFTALQPLFVVSWIAVFVVLAHRSLRAAQISSGNALAVATCAAAALATAPIMIIHGLILKNHAAFACYFLISYAALYIAYLERSVSWFVVSMAFAAILVWVRNEAAVTALPLLVSAAAMKAVDLRLRTLLAGTVGTCWAAWFSFLTIASAYSDHLERGHVYKGYIWVVLLLSLFSATLFVAAWRAGSETWRPAVARIVGLMPGAMIGVLLAGLLALAWHQPDKLLGVLRNNFFSFYAPDTGGLGLGVIFVAVGLVLIRKWLGQSAAITNGWALAGAALTIPFVFMNEAIWPGAGSPLLSSVRVSAQFVPAAALWLIIAFASADTHSPVHTSRR